MSDGKEGQLLRLYGVRDLIILDKNLPGKDGLSDLQELRRKKITPPVLLLTVRAAMERLSEM